MEKDLQLSNFFTDPLLLSYITQFLNIKQTLLLSALNKKLRFTMQQHFSSLLSDNNLNLIQGKSPIHQLHFYFGRCLRIFKNQKENDSKEQSWDKKEKDMKRKISYDENVKFKDVLKVTIENPLKFRVIKKFQVGPIFVGCLDNQDKAIIFRTNHLISLSDEKQKLNFRQEFGVKDLSVKGEKIVLVKSSGEIVQWEVDKQSQDINIQSTTLKWSQDIPAFKAHTSFTYALFQLQNPFVGRDYIMSHLFDYDHFKEKKNIEDLKEQMHLIGVNLLTNTTWLIKVPGSKLISVAVGHKDTYLVNQRHQCYVVEFDYVNQMQHQIVAKEYQPLSHKKIMKVSSGYNFFVALQRNVQFLEDWTVDRVAQWLREIGFGSFVRIVRAQKVDGVKLKNITKKYLENVLGMTKINMQSKLMLCIQEVNEGKNQLQQLWVWGKNESGQLGSANANYIAQPQRTKMDFLHEGDKIDRVFCGWYQSFVRTVRGKIYCSIRTSEKKKKKIVEEKEFNQIVFSDEEDFRKTEDNSKFKEKKKKKKNEEYREENKKPKGQKRFEEEQHWTELQAGKAFVVQAYKDHTFIIQCPDQQKFEPVKQKKLRTAKAVIDKILWGGLSYKSEYKIGIIDKDMGTIEVTPMQIQTFDYKEARVRYIKLNGGVVWDRENKIDHI